MTNLTAETLCVFMRSSGHKCQTISKLFTCSNKRSGRRAYRIQSLSNDYKMIDKCDINFLLRIGKEYQELVCKTYINLETSALFTIAKRKSCIEVSHAVIWCFLNGMCVGHVLTNKIFKQPSFFLSDNLSFYAFFHIKTTSILMLRIITMS